MSEEKIIFFLEDSCGWASGLESEDQVLFLTPLCGILGPSFIFSDS